MNSAFNIPSFQKFNRIVRIMWAGFVPFWESMTRYPRSFCPSMSLWVLKILVRNILIKFMIWTVAVGHANLRILISPKCANSICKRQIQNIKHLWRNLTHYFFSIHHRLQSWRFRKMKLSQSLLRKYRDILVVLKLVSQFYFSSCRCSSSCRWKMSCSCNRRRANWRRRRYWMWRN